MVRLEANDRHWNQKRGPRLREVVFRNDLTNEQAVSSVCDREGEIDLVTDITPAQVARIERSAFAKLISVDAVHVLVGAVNRYSDRFPFHDRRARQALNLALDRQTIIDIAMKGLATPLAGLTPLSATGALPHRLKPYGYEPEKASKLWIAAGGSRLPLRLGVPERWQTVAEIVKHQLMTALNTDCELLIYSDTNMYRIRRQLAEKQLSLPWDILLLDQGAQAADSVPLEIHRAFAGQTGEFRSGPVLPEFEALYKKLAAQISVVKQGRLAYKLDRLVFDEALALFICAPYRLYAVNKEVNFVPYRTTFELAECSVTRDHWSRKER